MCVYESVAAQNIVLMQYGESALILAARNGKTDAVVELIKEGADIDIERKVGCMYETSLSSEYQVYRLICHYTGWKHCSDLSFSVWD